MCKIWRVEEEQIMKAGKIIRTNYAVWYKDENGARTARRDYREGQYKVIPMTVLNFILDENNEARTRYQEFDGNTYKRTTYQQPEEAPAAEAEQQPTEAENAPQAATQAAEGTDEEKEAETMTTTEREALERINARQNAANHFTNIGPADIAAELAAMEAEQAAPAADPQSITTNEQKEEEKPMFDNLRNAVNAHFNQQAAKFAADLETITAAEALKRWYYSDRMTPAALEIVKAAAADQTATIPEAARVKMMKRYTNENEKSRALYLEKLDRAEAAEPLKDAAIVVDWTRSRTWGWNPTATVTVNGDYYRQTKDSASGCGYDKESAAICGAFNANPSIMRALYEHAEQGRKFPYSVSTYAGIPYFDGGCGVSCNYSVFEAIGYKFADVAHSRHGADVYSITRA